MSNEGGDDMAAAGPLDDEDLLGEILLRLPSNPSSLPRASLVCKRWRRISTNAAFCRRFRAHHRKPPMLGVFQPFAGELVFTSVLEPPDRIPRERFTLRAGTAGDYWSVLGCRHGRVLTINRSRLEARVFHPVSGDLRILSIPREFVGHGFANGAVLSTAGACHSSPFKVVLVGSRSHQEPTMARVYSSETGMWGDIVSMAESYTGYISTPPCTLVGKALYCCLYATRGNAAEHGILKFDLDNQSLTVISRPPSPRGSQIQIIRAEDGGLGLAIFSYPSFQLWDCLVDCRSVASWVLRRTFDVNEMLGLKANYADARIAGYGEDTDAILMTMRKASEKDAKCVLVIIQLESMKVDEHAGSFCTQAYHPFTNFYTDGTARV